MAGRPVGRALRRMVAALVRMGVVLRVVGRVGLALAARQEFDMSGIGIGGMEAVIAAEEWFVFWYAVWRARVALGVQR